MPCALRPLAIALLLLLAPLARAAGPTVLVLSLDGTSPEAVREAGLATLARLARNGATGELVPVFPSNTFPNHVTFVTGVKPERHGIVNNVFHDPERGLYRYASDPTWIEVEPLWSLLGRHGVPSAAFHWVGSEGAWRSGRGPRHWRPFDASVPEREKVDQILAWLDLADPEARPRLVTSWFRGADHAAHRHGVDAKEVIEALRAQDGAIARLVAGLDERGLWATTTLLVLSDHGSVPVERRVDLGRALEEAGLRARVLGGGGFASVVLAPGAEGPDEVVAVARRLGLEAHRRERAPAELGCANPRFGDVVVWAAPGTALGARRGWGRLGARVADLLGRAGPRAVHGYPAETPGMRALFVAFGRGVPAGRDLGPIPAVAIAPTVLALLGLPAPEWMEEPPLRDLLERAPRAPEREPAGEEGADARS